MILRRTICETMSMRSTTTKVAMKIAEMFSHAKRPSCTAMTEPMPVMMVRICCELAL